MRELIGDHCRCRDCANKYEHQSRVSTNFPLSVVHDVSSVSHRMENRMQRGPFHLGPGACCRTNVLMLENRRGSTEIARYLNSQPQKESLRRLHGSRRFPGALSAMGASRRYPTAHIIVSSREITAITFMGD